MQLTRTTMVNASADKVWQILGDDFNNVSNWASAVIDSTAIPDQPEGSGRVCNVKGFGQVTESIYHYDDNNRELSFILAGGKVPFFMRKIDNTWGVTPKGENRSELQVNVDITLMPVFKQLMTGMMTKQMTKQADGLLSELKYYAENGKAKAA